MGRTKDQIQKPATVHQLDTGKWAVFVTLVQPRELEGKMRSGRKKFERQTQALANDLCAEINAQLCGKELARQLSQREQDIAKKVFWEILEPRHPDWVDHLADIINHAEMTGYRLPDATVPTIAQAARVFYQEHMRNLEKETLINYRYMMAYLLPKFGPLKTYQMTDQQILELAYGTEPLKFMKSSVKPNHTAAEAEAHLWDTLEESKAKRPWTPHTIIRFLAGARVFKNWMHESIDPTTQARRNWCPKCTIEIPKEPKSANKPKRGLTENSDRTSDPECVMNPALTIPQVQAIIDVAWVAYYGSYAPFYVHAFWAGSRAKEISRTDATAFDSHDGMLTVSERAAKTDVGRESEVYPNAIIMVEALRSAGVYTSEGLQPNKEQRAVIHILAGFTSNAKQVLARAECERKRLEARGITLPKYNWGMPFPKNALRRTALSMHYRLFLSVALTTSWGGNSPRVFKEFYKRLVTKSEAREYWAMLPTWLKQNHVIKFELPKDHKLDSAMTEEVKSAVSAACVAMGTFQSQVATAEAQSVAAKFQERKTRNSEYMKAYRKRIQDEKANGKATETLVRESISPSSQDALG